jgi:hypothetical protein
LFAEAKRAMVSGSRAKPLITAMPWTLSTSAAINRSPSSLLRRYSGRTDRENQTAPIHKNGEVARQANVSGTCSDSM